MEFRLFKFYSQIFYVYKTSFYSKLLTKFVQSLILISLKTYYLSQHNDIKLDKRYNMG